MVTTNAIVKSTPRLLKSTKRAIFAKSTNV